MAEKDIVPELIENINNAFRKNCIRDVEMRKLSEKAADGAATYSDAYKYAESIGTARANAFKSEVSSDVLPDGRMYYNIASRVMEDSLTTDHEMVANFAQQVQETINKNAGISLKAQKADLDEDRIDGFVQRLSREEDYDKASWLLNEPIKTHARSVVDDTVKKNAAFQHKAGIKVQVKRDAASDCCKWCDSLVGDYTYPGVPREVFARHDNCRCSLDYNGKKLTAYQSGGVAHSFRDQGETEKIKERNKYAESISQDYKKVVRNADKKESITTGKETISATALENSRNNLYLSDEANLKPREFDRIEKQVDFAKSVCGINKENAPRYVIVSDTEFKSSTQGRFDPNSNTIFIKVQDNKSEQQLVIVHETFHAKDYQRFIEVGGTFTDQKTYVEYISEKSREKLDSLGINIYNVSEISEYAHKTYEIGRYDETFTEYRSVKAMREKK